MADFLHRDDAEIVGRVLSGQRDEFGRLVERYMPMVHALVRANLGLMGDIDDIAQDAFLSAFHSLDKLRNPEKFAGWLASITRHECVRYAKVRQRAQRNAVAWRNTSPASTTDDPAKRELHQMLEQAVHDLDVQHREILLLYYFSKKDMGEIEAILDIPREAAKKRLQRARAVLESHITSQVGELLEAYAPHKEHAAKVSGAIAMAQPVWLLTSKTGAASALTGWSTLVMKAKTLAVMGTVALLAGLGIVSYSLSVRDRETSAVKGARPYAARAVNANDTSLETASRSEPTPNRANVTAIPATNAPSTVPAASNHRVAKSDRSSMVGGNPQRTGFFDVPAPLTLPTVRWTSEMSGSPGTTSAIDAQGRIFMSHGDARGPDWLSAFSPNGEPLWDYGPVDYIRSTGAPAITPDGNVLFAFNDHVTRAFDPITGATAWSAEFASRELLVDSKGNVYTSSRAGLEKVDASSGVALWEPLAQVTPPAALSLDEHTLYARAQQPNGFLTVDFSLQAINAENGDVLWRYVPEGNDDFMSNWATPVVGGDGTVFIQDAGLNVLYAIRDNGDSASQLWEFWPATAHASQPFEPTSAEFVIYNATGDSPRLVATDGEAVYMGVFGNHAFGGYPASVHAVSMDGQSIWHTPLEGDVVAGSPVVTNDAVYILGGGSDDFPGTNALYCLDRDDGRILWQMSVSPPHGDVGESIALAPDGTIYIATTAPNGSGSILRALR